METQEPNIQGEKKYDIGKVKELMQFAKHIAVIPSKISGADAFSAGVGLYNMILANGKDATFVYPGKIPQVCEEMRIINPKEIHSDTSSRSLLVSIDYSQTPASTIKYSTENDALQLIVSPISKEFDPSRVKARAGLPLASVRFSDSPPREEPSLKIV